MRVDDFICLGRTVPEESRKYGHKVCMAGVSQELRSMMRVYPLPVQNNVRMRRSYCMELERNKLDSRHESWKLADRVHIEEVSTKEMPYADVRGVVAPYFSSSIAELNERRASLGVIIPTAVSGRFETRPGVASSLQGTLWDDLDDTFGANAIDLIPRLEFHDTDGWHDLQLREWGCYEFLRRYRHRADELWKALALSDASRQPALVVGNMCHQRTVWLIVSVLRLPRVTETLPLFKEAECVQ